MGDREIGRWGDRGIGRIKDNGKEIYSDSSRP
jgi:hypothetical protein